MTRERRPSSFSEARIFLQNQTRHDAQQLQLQASRQILRHQVFVIRLQRRQRRRVFILRIQVIRIELAHPVKVGAVGGVQQCSKNPALPSASFHAGRTSVTGLSFLAQRHRSGAHGCCDKTHAPAPCPAAPRRPARCWGRRLKWHSWQRFLQRFERRGFGLYAMFLIAAYAGILWATGQFDA